MRLLFLLQEIPQTVDPKREALQSVFALIVGIVFFAWLAYFAAYLLFLRRTTPEKKAVRRGYVVVGPFDHNIDQFRRTRESLTRWERGSAQELVVGPMIVIHLEGAVERDGET